MSTLREKLSEDLAAKVERHGVVVWDDPDRSYEAVAHDVMPDGVRGFRFEDSWYDLRHDVESQLAGTEPPSMVVYVSASPKDPDPLEELRSVGTRYRITLPTLIKQALGGQLTEQRITQLGRQCSTVDEVESALDGGGTEVDARLISLVGDTSIAAIAPALLASDLYDQAVDRGLLDAVRDTFEFAFGGSYSDIEASDLQDAAFRQAALNLVAEKMEQLPEFLVQAHAEATTAQIKTSRATIDALQSQREFHNAYMALASNADSQFRLDDLTIWEDDLGHEDVTEALDVVALREGVRRLTAKGFDAACDVAKQRLQSSWWLRSEAPNGNALSAKWRAIRALANLGITTAKDPADFGSLDQLADWYAEEGWKADRAFRLSEFVRVTSGAALEELDDLYVTARKIYETWLENVLHSASSAVIDAQVPSERLQRAIYEKHVRRAPGTTAYVFVDALRYELGKELSDRLRSVPGNISIDYAVGTPPTITPVGMAALLPKADISFSVSLADSGRVEVRVGGTVMKSVPDRITALEQDQGEVSDLDLDRVAQYSNRELKKRIDGADLVLVRSTELDAEGENDMLAASWGSFDSTLNVLQTAVAKLLHAGIDRVVIAADHGFLALRQLGEERRIKKPSTGKGELHRRVWIGRGGSSTDSTVRVPLAAFGISGDLDIIAPRGLGVFMSGGGLQFFHGGLSPQELVVPIITVVRESETLEPKYEVSIEVAGGRITTGVIAVRIEMSGDLFTRESKVRLQLIHDGEQAAAIVGGDGVDIASGTIDVSVDATQVITMRVTSNLSSGSSATLEVLDAATGVKLGSTDVEVGADVIVDEEL